MKHHPLPLLAIPFALCLSSCVLDENGNIPGTYGDSNANTSTAPRGFTQPLSATTGQGTVTIREGDRILSTIRTAAPNVEQTRWHSEQEQILVKSRGNHGPATVELFDSRTGTLRDKVLAYAIKNGQPAWAATMAE